MVFLVVLAACGGDSTGPKVDNSFIGNLTLQTVNGQRLPYVAVQQGNNSVTIAEDHLNISDGGSWVELTTYTVVTNGATTTQLGNDGGTWVRSGNQLFLTDGKTNTIDYTGTFANGTVTITGSGGAIFVFTK